MAIQLAPIDIAVFLLYVAAIVAIGVRAARQGGKSSRDYFLAGDKLPWWMIGGSIVAANISSQHMVGGMGVAYSRGFVAMTMEWGAILLGLNALLWVFLPYYLRNGFYTMPEYLKRRFGEIPRMVYATLILLTYLLVEVSVVLYIGGIAIQALLDIPAQHFPGMTISPVSISIWVMAIATGIYTVTGGLRAVVWTEMFQLAVLLAGGVALTVATLIRIGGPASILETSGDWRLLLPANDPDFPWTMYLGGSLCVSVFYFATNQFIVQRVLAAKSEWHARMGVVFTSYLKFLIPLIIIVPGLAAVQLYPDLEKPDLVFPTLVKDLLPSGLVGLVMAGLVAAVMSHISGAVNSCSTIAAMDFYVPVRDCRRRRARSGGDGEDAKYDSVADDRGVVRFGRLFGIVTLLLGIVLAEVIIRNSDRPIFLYIFSAYGYFTPGIATMFLMGIFWKRTTAAGALTAGILTIPLSLFLDWSVVTGWLHRQEWAAWFMSERGIPFQNRTGIVFWACMLACILVSLFTTPKKEEELEGLVWKVDSLRMPEDGSKRRWYARPFLWWLVVTIVTLLMYVVFGLTPLLQSDGS